MAKLEFIEKGYDYNKNVQGLNLEVFRQIMEKNQSVNDTVKNFVGKLDTTKQETIKFEALKASFNFDWFINLSQNN